MSSATASQYAECDEFIQYQIESARRRIKWTELLTALLLTGVLLIGYILAFTVCDHWLVPGGFGAWTRAGMLAGVVFTCMGILYWFVIRPWTKQINPVFAAQMLDSEDPEFNGSLMSAVDLQQGDIQAPEQIRTAIEKRAAVRLADVDLEQAIDRNRMMQLAVALFALVLTTCLYAVFSPKSIDLLRPLSTANSTVATRTQILKVTPGDARVDAGQQLEITVDIGGTIPEQVLLTYTTADRSYVDEEVILETTDDEGRFRILLIGEADRGIRQDFTYQIHAGDSVSQDFYVEVTEPPRAIVTGMNLTYPEYMELEPRVVQQGSIDVWEGTVVKLHAEANVPLKSAILRFSDDPTFATRAEEIVLRTEEKKIHGEFRMNLRVDQSFPKFYRIDVKDTDDRTDPDPTVYSVNVRPDKSPVVRLLDPIRDLSTPSNGIIPLLITAADPDFKLQAVELSYQINDDERIRREPVFDATREGLRQAWSGTWEFDLEPLNLQPGDQIAYYITARDNKPPRGSQSRTQTLNLLIEPPATEQEVQDQLKQDREHQEQQLKQQQEQQEQGEQQDRESEQEGNPQQGDPKQGEQSEDGEEGSESGSQEGERGSQNDQNSNAGSEQTGSEQTGSEQSSTEGEQDSENNGEGEAGDQRNRENESEGAESDSKRQNDRATDDEALNRILEKYRESENKDGNSQPNTGEATEKPDGQESPPNQSDDQTGSEQSGDEKTESDQTGDDKTGSEQSGDEKTGSEQTGDDKTGSEQSGDEKAGSEQTGDDKTGSEQSGDEETGSEQTGDDKTGSEQSGDEKTGNEQTGDDKTGSEQSGDEKTGSEQTGDDKTGSEQSGDEKTGSEQTGDDKTGSEQSGDEETGSEQTGDDKTGSEQSGDEKSGSEQTGDDKTGSEQSGDEKSGSEQSGDNKTGSEQSGDEKSGSEQSGDNKTGSEQSGDEKSGSEQSGDEKNGSEQPGDEKSGGEKSGGEKSSGEQSGEEKPAGDQSGDEKSGKEKSGKEKSGSEQSGEQKDGDQKKSPTENDAGKGQKGEGEGSKSPSDPAQEKGQPGQNQSGANQKGGKSGSGDGQSDAEGMGHSGSTAGGAEQKDPKVTRNDNQKAKPGTEAADTPTDQSNIDDAAAAADLALQRLKQDLDRGKVDQKLLDELGWTKEELERFSEQMHDRLNSLKDKPAAEAERLQQRRVEEMLKSLDLTSTPQERIGSNRRDREQRDTTARRSKAPSRLRDLQKMFRKSVSRGRQGSSER